MLPLKKDEAGDKIILTFHSQNGECVFDTGYPINYDAVSAVTVGGVRQVPIMSYKIEDTSIVFDCDFPSVDIIVEIIKSKVGCSTTNKKIFIVHGHDEVSKLAVARFLTAIDFDPIILHEQPNRGATIIEKFEKHADVAFAVVLMTPDDFGGKDRDGLRPRARQNVVAELGYFIGKLGRERVAALKKGDVEIPSDFNGVLYTPLDDLGAWKMKLVNELDAAGLDIDFKKATNA